TANSFAAVGIECDWLLATHEQPFIQNIEHFQKPRVRRDVFHVVIDKFAGGFWIRLPPNAQAKVHSCEEQGQSVEPSAKVVGAPGGRALPHQLFIYSSFVRGARSRNVAARDAASGVARHPVNSTPTPPRDGR